MKRYVIKTLLNSSFQKITREKDKFFVQAAHDFYVMLPSLHVRYVTYTGKAPKHMEHVQHFKHVYTPTILPHHLLHLLNTVDHLSVYRLAKNGEIYELLVNKKTITFTKQDVTFNGKTYRMNHFAYREPMFEYIFNRQLTEDDRRVLTIRLASRYAQELQEHEFIQLLEHVNMLAYETVEDLLVHTALSAMHAIFENAEDIKVPTYGQYALYMSTSQEDIDEAISILTNKPFYERVKQMLVVKRVECMEARQQQIAQREQEKQEEVARRQQEKERAQQLKEQQEENNRKQEAARIKAMEQEEIRRQQNIKKTITAYEASCQQLVETTPYEEWLIEEWSMKADVGSEIEINSNVDLQQFFETNPSNALPCLFSCGGYKQYNSTVVKRLIAGQRLVAYVLPRGRKSFDTTYPTVYIQSVRNEERRQQVFADVQAQLDMAYEHYMSKLQAKAKEPFVYTFCSLFKGEKVDYFDFLASSGRIVIALIDGELYFVTENGIRLEKVKLATDNMMKLNKMGSEMIEEAYAQGQMLYGIKTKSSSKYGKEHVHYQISNREALLSPPTIEEKKHLFFQESISERRYYVSSDWKPPTTAEYIAFEEACAHNDIMLEQGMWNFVSSPADISDINYRKYLARDEIVPGEPFLLQWETEKTYYDCEYVKINIVREDGYKVGVISGDNAIHIAYALHQQIPYKAYASSERQRDSHDVKIYVVFSL